MDDIDLIVAEGSKRYLSGIEKTCSGCGKTLPIKDFPKGISSFSTSNQCRKCHNKKSVNYKRNKREYDKMMKI